MRMAGVEPQVLTNIGQSSTMSCESTRLDPECQQLCLQNAMAPTVTPCRRCWYRFSACACTSVKAVWAQDIRERSR